jgi:hypothetical protein
MSWHQQPHSTHLTNIDGIYSRVWWPSKVYYRRLPGHCHQRTTDARFATRVQHQHQCHGDNNVYNSKRIPCQSFQRPNMHQFDGYIIPLMSCDAGIRGPECGPPFVFCNDVHPPSQFIVVTSIDAQTLSLRITASPKRRSVSKIRSLTSGTSTIICLLLPPIT